MSATPGSSTVSMLSKSRVWIAVVLLLTLYAGLALAASTYKGPSFDEGEELAVGYNIWLHHDFRMEGANGDLVKRWATLPYLISRPNFPNEENSEWRTAFPYVLGYDLFFREGNSVHRLLLQGRAMAVLLGVATGLLIFLCAREISGAAGALLALLFFAFSPNMLAFGGIVSTEMPTCLTLLGSTWCVWRLLHRITWGNLFASLIFLSLLLLSKPSGLVIFPITAILIIVKLFSSKPLEWRLGAPRQESGRWAQVGIFCGLIFIHGLFSWAALWTHYEFRYSASPNPADPGIIMPAQGNMDPIEPSVQDFLSWCRHTHFLPEGYLAGIKLLLGQNDQRPSFMDGNWISGGTRLFFFRAIWDKTPPELLALLALGLVGSCGLWLQHRAALRQSPSGPAHPLGPAFYETIPHLILIATFLTVAVEQDVNIGHRHILPVYPSIYILAGSALAFVWARGFRWLRWVVALLLLGSVAETIAVYPNYLAYFSPVVGGAPQGYTHLVDSSLDWGMDLPGLKQWLNQNNPGNKTPVFLAYFGTDSPTYRKIQAHYLPCFFDWRPKEVFPLSPGIYAISASLLQAVYSPCFGPWNKEYEASYQASLKNILLYQQAMGDPAHLAVLLAQHPQSYWDGEYANLDNLRFGRLCAWLRHHHPPDDNVGYSILIWRLNISEISDALLGPPAELADHPVAINKIM